MVVLRVQMYKYKALKILNKNSFKNNLLRRLTIENQTIILLVPYVLSLCCSVHLYHGLKLRCWSFRRSRLGLNPGSAICQLCDLGQVESPL